MSVNVSKSWLVAYDIREPRRLRRIHRHLRKEGASVQYSVFVVEANDRGMDRLVVELQALVAPVDDVRAYHVPERCEVWTLGKQALPEGVLRDPAGVAWLIGRVIDPSETQGEGGGELEREIPTQ